MHDTRQNPLLCPVTAHPEVPSCTLPNLVLLISLCLIPMHCHLALRSTPYSAARDAGGLPPAPKGALLSLHCLPLSTVHALPQGITQPFLHPLRAASRPHVHEFIQRPATSPMPCNLPQNAHSFVNYQRPVSICRLRSISTPCRTLPACGQQDERAHNPTTTCHQSCLACNLPGHGFVKCQHPVS